MIGSSPRCNLRIEQPGVQPLHCLIVHGSEGLSVRRWAADTQLNGVPLMMHRWRPATASRLAV